MAASSWGVKGILPSLPLSVAVKVRWKVFSGCFCSPSRVATHSLKHALLWMAEASIRPSSFVRR